MMYKYRFAEVEAIKVTISEYGCKRLDKWLKRNFNEFCSCGMWGKDLEFPYLHVEINNDKNLFAQTNCISFNCYVIKQENKIEIMDIHDFESAYSPRYIPTIRFWE